MEVNHKLFATIALCSVFLFVGSCKPVTGVSLEFTPQPSAEVSSRSMLLPSETPQGIDNSTATPVSGATRTAQQNNRPECTESQGRIERVEYPSSILGEYIQVLVYLPPCYSEGREYPALFLLHGKPQDENHWQILGIVEVVDRFIGEGQLEGLILVMPAQPEPLFSQTDGGAGSYEGEFLSALLPFIEQQYAVSSDAEKRAVAGISRGGVWALEIAFSNPGIFAGTAALSPALNVNDARESYDPLAIASSEAELPERIFLASGDFDSAAEATEQLHMILTNRGFTHRYTVVPGGHEGGTWKQLLVELLEYLTAGW